MSTSRSFATDTLGMYPCLEFAFLCRVCHNTFRLKINIVLYLLTNLRDYSNAGYCFVEFNNPDAANKALQLNGTPVPNSDRVFRLNWASGGGLVDRRDDRSPEYSIFVGDLGHEVNEFVLVALFQARFASCKSAKIMTDQQTGQSRGYGFVRFSDEQDQQRALVEMQGVYCGNRPMRVSPATPKNRYASIQFSIPISSHLHMNKKSPCRAPSYSSNVTTVVTKVADSSSSLAVPKWHRPPLKSTVECPSRGCNSSSPAMATPSRVKVRRRLSVLWP